MVNFKQQGFLVLFVSFLPLLVLLFRGLVWGADSFAFMAVACGQQQYAVSLSSPGWFTSLLPFFNCNFLLIVFVMWFFYFLALIGLWLFAKNIFLGEWFERWNDSAWLLPCLVGTVTPLFFVEALRFENDFFGWTIAFLVLGLFTLVFKGTKNSFKAIVLILCTPLAFICTSVWLPSIIILSVCLFVLPVTHKIQQVLWILLIGTYSILNYNFLLSSFTNLNQIVAEEMPLLGLIFIIHIISFYKYVPRKYLIPTIALIGLGLIKMKYMFIATPFLILGLIQKEKNGGIEIKGSRIPIIFIILILGFGWVITSVNLFPTQSDLKEIKELIELSEDQNIPMYNDFGNGWLITFMGKETDYKIGYPEPDYNNLPRPFYAYSSKKLEKHDCVKLNKKTYFCES